ncbi:hypothetical protein BKH43_06920 [Helicobacter sp. 13S00401-1]|uniref:hypothetical protein n=1 Tax=Helicobacter sp. 13S00401-1 TaxID=1905758 RepID=UPI000BA53B6A|nr:hypothetical protein [Helicobacter sp. 13S00401-1]PAF49307.1 hypothetical protein BKH43_06920 [Helicobacter sp. 13S00401-1]
MKYILAFLISLSLASFTLGVSEEIVIKHSYKDIYTQEKSSYEDIDNIRKNILPLKSPTKKPKPNVENIAFYKAKMTLLNNYDQKPLTKLLSQKIAAYLKANKIKDLKGFKACARFNIFNKLYDDDKTLTIDFLLDNCKFDDESNLLAYQNIDAFKEFIALSKEKLPSSKNITLSGVNVDRQGVLTIALLRKGECSKKFPNACKDAFVKKFDSGSMVFSYRGNIMGVGVPNGTY